jgi:hypothetical protein
LRRGSSSWANATLAYSDLSGTPTIPDSGADVGLADSPSTDGDYVLRRASGVNTWETAAGGGGSGWIACTAAGVTTINSSEGSTLATCTLPAGWRADGAQIEWSFDVLCTANASSVSMYSSVGFSNTGNLSDGIFQLYGSQTHQLSPGAGFSLWGEGKIVALNMSGTGALWGRGHDVYMETHQGQSNYQEYGSLASITRIVLTGQTTSGTMNVSVFFPKMRITTPD